MLPPGYPILWYLTRLVKNQFNFKQIIQILQPIIIDNFLTHSYIVDISSYILLVSFTIYFKGRVLLMYDATDRSKISSDHHR